MTAIPTNAKGFNSLSVPVSVPMPVPGHAANSAKPPARPRRRTSSFMPSSLTSASSFKAPSAPFTHPLLAFNPLPNASSADLDLLTAPASPPALMMASSLSSLSSSWSSSSVSASASSLKLLMAASSPSHLRIEPYIQLCNKVHGFFIRREDAESLGLSAIGTAETCYGSLTRYTPLGIALFNREHIVENVYELPAPFETSKYSGGIADLDLFRSLGLSAVCDRGMITVSDPHERTSYNPDKDDMALDF
ncbi:hypothetical protein BC831DRAFT_460005 [Entophlyctis helioformis]|nr:hypothetical protein BC831DRAFT_460005 [Entophlyctis helioformis]